MHKAKRLSIKAHVTAWFALIMFLLATLVFAAMILHRTNQINKNSKQTLQTSVERFLDAVSKNGVTLSENDTPPKRDTLPPAENTLPPPPDTPLVPHGNKTPPKTYGRGVHIALYNEHNEAVLGQIPFEFSEISFQEGDIYATTQNDERYFVLDKKITLGTGVYWIKGVCNISGSLNAANATLTADYALICILILIAAIGGYFIVGRALAPITKIRKTAIEITESEDLSRRISLGEGKDEVYHLAAVFDEMLDKIERSFEAEKQFTADASHELRTPVSVILSESEYALDCAKTEDEWKESLAVVYRQGEKMSKLIATLLAISRMDRKDIALNFTKTNLSELLTIICDEQQATAVQNITLKADIAPNVFAYADSALLGRLFVNLISNAMQYGQENGNVWVGLSCEKENIVFTVTDDGIGIEHKELSNIWERFYQVNKSRANENGSLGLGLSMVKQIAALHHGVVTVNSTPGKGSTFTFTMPLAF